MSNPGYKLETSCCLVQKGKTTYLQPKKSRIEHEIKMNSAVTCEQTLEQELENKKLHERCVK